MRALTMAAAWGSMLLALATRSCTGQLGTDEMSAGPGQGNGYNINTEAAGDDGRSLYFYYGPMKLMLGESILYSLEKVTGHDFGSWEPTTPDPATQAFVDAGNGDKQFYRHCRLLGGCMEHRIPQGRTSFVGTAYVLELEKSVTEACSDRSTFGMFPSAQAPDSKVSAQDIIRHQYVTAFGVEPTDGEKALSGTYFKLHLADPEFDDVSPMESAGRGHCRAILATNRFLFF